MLHVFSFFLRDAGVLAFGSQILDSLRFRGFTSSPTGTSLGLYRAWILVLQNSTAYPFWYVVSCGSLQKNSTIFLWVNVDSIPA